MPPSLYPSKIEIQFFEFVGYFERKISAMHNPDSKKSWFESSTYIEKLLL